MSTEPVTLKRIHAHRLRDVYRSEGWPYQDVVDVDLLAAGLLERVNTETGHGLVRVTDAGLLHMAGARYSGWRPSEQSAICRFGFGWRWPKQHRSGAQIWRTRKSSSN